MRTLRRLNDPTTYYGLSWRGWVTASVAAVIAYLAVRFSPFSFKPTITVTLIVLGLAGSSLYSLGGQALGIGRYLSATIGWRLGHKHYSVPGARPVRGGVLVDAVPRALAAVDPEHGWPTGSDITEGSQ